MIRLDRDRPADDHLQRRQLASDDSLGIPGNKVQTSLLVLLYHTGSEHTMLFSP